MLGGWEMQLVRQSERENRKILLGNGLGVVAAFRPDWTSMPNPARFRGCPTNACQFDRAASMRPFGFPPLPIPIVLRGP